MIKVKIKRTPEDYITAYQAAAISPTRTLYKFSLLWPFIIITIVILMYTALHRSNSHQVNASNDSEFLWILCISIPSLVFWYFFNKEKSNKSKHPKSKTFVFSLPGFHQKVKKGIETNPSMILEENLIITAEGVNLKNANADLETKWNQYIRALITNDTLLLYTTESAFSCYPARFFTAEEYTALRELVKQYIPNTTIIGEPPLV
jgi:hypothetical protein